MCCGDKTPQLLVRRLDTAMMTIFASAVPVCISPRTRTWTSKLRQRKQRTVRVCRSLCIDTQRFAAHACCPAPAHLCAVSARTAKLTHMSVKWVSNDVSRGVAWNKILSTMLVHPLHWSNERGTRTFRTATHGLNGHTSRREVRSLNHSGRSLEAWSCDPTRILSVAQERADAHLSHMLQCSRWKACWEHKRTKLQMDSVTTEREDTWERVA